VRSTHGGFQQHWREVMGTFLKIGALSYSGAASVGIMQAEVLKKRAWIHGSSFSRGWRWSIACQVLVGSSWGSF
jgi:chromate transport protein ChrA